MNKVLKQWGKLGFYILLPIAFVLIPTSWLEARRPLCLFRMLFHRPCPGCGMTRAVSCVAHGQFKKAFQYNKLVVIVLPILSYSWLQATLRALHNALEL